MARISKKKENRKKTGLPQEDKRKAVLYPQLHGDWHYLQVHQLCSCQGSYKALSEEEHGAAKPTEC